MVSLPLKASECDVTINLPQTSPTFGSESHVGHCRRLVAVACLHLVLAVAGAHLQFRSCSFAVANSHGQFALTALPLDGPASGRLGLWKVLLLDGAASGSVGAWQVASQSTV